MKKKDGRFSCLAIDSKYIRDMDKGLLAVSILLALYGMLNIYLCTKGELSDYGAFYFVKKQAISFFISLIILYIFVAVDYKTISDFILIFYIASIILLLAVWIPGIGIKVNGARGWLDLKVYKFQPAEIAKFSIILVVAKLLEEMEGNVNNIKNLIKIGVYVAIPMGLILMQPDMGMGMVCFFIVLGMLFMAGLDKRIIIGGFTFLAVSIVILWNSGLILDHQKARLTTFMNADSTDVSEGDGYQLAQSLIGIGSGGIIGNKPSLSSEVSPGYTGTHVPEVQTDFIFAAVGEQFGFIGAIILLLLYGILIVKMINIARSTKDQFGSLICVGIISYFLFAIMQNIGMTIGLMPITGITLPLISYGGSSLLTTMMAIALVLNVGMRKQKIHF